MEKISNNPNKTKLNRWYFGGLSSAGATFFTHPFETIKVTLQTQQEGKLMISKLTRKIIRQQGFFALYNGLSASVLRQLFYSTTRYGLYDVGKKALGNDIGFVTKIMLAGASGVAGGFVGTPTDMINVRMQNDVKLPPQQRRNYKNVIDGLLRVHREEGFQRLFSGTSPAMLRGFTMTIGQMACYDQTKTILLKTGYFEDNSPLHFLSSLIAGGVTTTLILPVDVIKTRSMNAKPGEFSSLWAIIKYTAELGPSGFYKGFAPAFLRIGSHTVLTFYFMEQMRFYFGYYQAS